MILFDPLFKYLRKINVRVKGMGSQ